MHVDLHLHSAWSDGSMDIRSVVRLAKRLKLEAIAVTDHDTAAHLRIAADEGRRQGLPVIPGTEISAFDPGTGRKVHLLGYHIRDAQKINRACRPYLEERHQANLRALDRVREAGYPIDREDVLPYVGSGGVLYRVHIMRALVECGYTAGIYGDLYHALFGKNGAAFVPTRYMPAKDAVELIKSAGGFAVLAHPFQYDSMELLPELTAWGLDGIEYRHHTQTAERQKAVQWAAEKHRLFLTGGSDWHGLYSEKPALRPGAMKVNLQKNHPLFRREEA
jgi:predicted metal-dependent phosphoesterase TrpH